MKELISLLIFSLLNFKVFFAMSAAPLFESGTAPWGSDAELAPISHTFSENSHTLSPELHRQGNETVLIPHCPCYPDDESQIKELPFFSKKCGKLGLGYIKKEKSESEKSKGAVLSTGQKSCRAMIRFFQMYISPIDGPRSSFYPTSSQYALEAIQKYGVFKGIALGCDRLMRENGEMWVYETINKHGTKRKLNPVD